MIIRPETPADHPAIDWVVDAAFGSTIESRLIRLIRESAGYLPGLSLVAEIDGEIVGHVMFSRVTIEGAGTHDVLSLAPLAVAPSHQNRGIGTALTTDGIERIRVMGEPLVVVEGHPRYYPRFGFVPGSAVGVEKPAAEVPDAAFMVLRLTRAAADITGKLVYPPPFHQVGAIGP
jgi:putative acetyltransferase